MTSALKLCRVAIQHVTCNYPVYIHNERRTAASELRINMVNDPVVTLDIHVIENHATIENMRSSVKWVVTK